MVINKDQQSGSFAKKWQKLLAADGAVCRQRLRDLARGVFSRDQSAPEAELIAETKATNTDALAGQGFSVEDTIDVQGVPTLGGVSFADLFEEPADTSDAWVLALQSAGCRFESKVRPPLLGHGSILSTTEGEANKDPLAGVHIGMDTYGRVRFESAKAGRYVYRSAVGRTISGLPVAPGLDALAVSVEQQATFIAVVERLLGIVPEDGQGEVSADGQPEGSMPLRVLLVDYPNHPLPALAKQTIYSRTKSICWESSIATVASGLRLFGKCYAAFDLLVSREAGFIHRYWMQEYAAQYPQALRERLQRAVNVSPQKLTDARALQQQVRSQLLEWLGEWYCVAIPLVIPAGPLDATTVHRINRQLAPIQLSGLPAFSIPVQSEPDYHIALQLLVRPDCANISSLLRQF